MSEQTTQSAGQPGNTATQPGTSGTAASSQPLSQPQIDPNEYARYKREAEQARGMRPYYEAGNKYGLKSADQLNEVGELYKTLSERGIRPSQVASMFGNQVAQQTDSASEVANMSKADIEKMIGERLTKAQADMIRAQAEKEHESSVSGEYDRFTTDTMKGWLGEGADDTLAELARYAAIGKYGEVRKPYGDDHPLKGMYGPAGKDGLGEIEKWLKESATKLRASQSLALGAAARKTVSSTPAGNGSGQGQPKNEGRPGDFLAQRRAAAEAMAEKLAAQKRARG
jgi:hypothetical protein